jgi:hypothetical protein
MRSISNLTSMSKDYALDARRLRSGFIGLYDGKIGAGKNSLAEIYYLLVIGGLIPALRELEFPIAALNDIVSFKLKDTDFKRVVNSVLRKNTGTKRLEFRTPLCVVANGSYLNSLSPEKTIEVLRRTGNQDLLDSYNNSGKLENTPLAAGRVISGKEAAATFGFSPKVKELIAHCLIQIDATLSGNMVTIWATFGIDKEEVEYLTNSSFTEVRLSDIYPTLIEWVAGVFGRFKRPPKSVTKVSAIAEGVREAGSKFPIKPRIGMEDLVVDIKGDYYYIPEVDQSADYEQKLLDYGIRDDNSYSWDVPKEDVSVYDNINVYDVKPGEPILDRPYREPKRKMPKNMPIFSDWLNDMFSYSNGNGNLDIYDLSDTAPVANYHIAQLLKTPIKKVVDTKGSSIGKVFGQFLQQAAMMDPTINQEKPKPEDCDVPAQQALWDDFCANFSSTGVRMRVETALQLYSKWSNEVRRWSEGGGDLIDLTDERDLKLADVCPGTKIGAFKFIGRMIERGAKVIDNNIEVVYQRLSVMTSLQLMAYGRLLTKYGSQYDSVNTADMKQREVYLNQGIDPKYTQDGCPYVNDDLKFQPHQAKCDNIMRGSPDFAAYDVDAGGGKTILVITNILNEMKKGVCKRPIVACPSTLVSQYVEEFVFVTRGMVNCIPITNSTMRMHGEERLKMMLDRAPINTVVVTDYDFVAGKARAVSYGNLNVTVLTNAEWLRQFEFDLIAVDECHKLANLKSNRRAGMARLMQDIPKKRLASGTFVNNTPGDLVSQIALFDPTIFGSPEAFADEYAANVAGEKIVAWKPGAEKAIRKKIAEHVVFASARRKEWAALLPESRERFHAVDLTHNQQILYEAILDETAAKIQEAQEKDPELKEAMESEDESIAEELEGMLKAHLWRLERFLSAPGEDEAAATMLHTPEDLISPKVAEIYKICHDHFAGVISRDRDGEVKESTKDGGGINGKVLIFTNFLASAEAIFKHAPPELKKYMLHYKAEQKMEARAAFSRDANMRIMMGASSSMDTGLNFQHVSRLIRMETVWTPGLVEQGNSRVNRPQLKKTETRKMVFFDWIMVNRTIDITKVSRLTAKMISKAKFDEADSGIYDYVPGETKADDKGVESLPMISMNLDNIREMNDFTTTLVPYLEGYDTYKHIEKQEYARYREMNEGNLDPTPVVQAPVLKDSKFMSRVPYVPGMTIYGTDQLGLIRFDEFVHADASSMDENTPGGGADDKDDDEDELVDEKDLNPRQLWLRKMKAKWAAENALCKGMPCHTEFGDGVIERCRIRVKVRLANGDTVLVPKLQCFVITRTTTNGKDMRKELLKAAGKLPLDAPIEVPVEEGSQTALIKRKKKGGDVEEVIEDIKEQEALSASFSIMLINDMLALVMDGTDKPKACAAVQNFGFKMSPEYYFTRIAGPVVMLKLLKAMRDKGFTVSKQNSSELKIIYDLLKTDKRKMSLPGFATTTEIREFDREFIKPSAEMFLMKIYPRVEDGKLYLMMPKKGQASTLKAIRIPSPTIKWLPGGGEAELIKICANRAALKKVLQDIDDSGIIIENRKTLNAQWKALKGGA